MRRPRRSRTATSGDSASRGRSRPSRASCCMDEPAAGLPEAEVPELRGGRPLGARRARRGRAADRPQHGADHGRLRPRSTCSTRARRSPRGRRRRSAPTSTSPRRTSARAPCTEDDDVTAARVEGLDVRYGGVAPSAASRSRSAGRDRRPDRPERRRQVVDAARDHGRSCRSRPATSCSAARRCVGRRPRTSRAAGSHSCPKGGASSPSSPSRRTSASASPAAAARTACARRSRGVYALFPVVEEFRAPPCGRALRRPAAAARDRAGARREPDVLLLDEPSLGLAPRIVDVVFEALAAIRERGLAVLLVEQRAQRTVALADRSLRARERRAAADARPRRTPATPRRWWPPTSHDARRPRRRLADARRRGRRSARSTP